MIHAYFVPAAGETAFPAESWIQLRVFDFYGESYLTSRIPILSDDTPVNAEANAKAIAAAIKAVKNLTFKNVLCEPMG